MVGRIGLSGVLTMISRVLQLLVLGAGLAWQLCSSVAYGQSAGTGLMAPNVARHYGLERIWHSQVEAGRGRARVNHVTPFVSSSETTTSYEVKMGTLRFVFNQGDRDSLGRPLGEAGAERKANDLVEKLKRQYPDATDLKAEKVVVPLITLYCTTSRGVVHAIDGETGATRWTNNIANPDYPITSAAANDKFVAYCSGSTLFVLNAANGELAWQRKTHSVPGAGPAMSSEYIFIPMTNGGLESYNISRPKEEPWSYRGLGHALVSPTFGLNTVVWPTDRGHLYVADGFNRAIRYRLEASGVFSSAVSFWPPDQFFASTADGYVYSMHPTKQIGNITWRYSSGEMITQSPVPCGDLVFVITDEKNLLCLDMKDGDLLWKTPGATRYLGSSKAHVYVVGPAGRVLVIDKKTGGRVSDIPTEEFDLQILNPFTDRIYFGTRTGTIQCLREIGETWPTVHMGVKESAPKAKPKVIQQELPGGQKPAGGKGDDDPFGGPKKGNDDDPFAAPKPAGKKNDDDPFGAPAPKPAPKPKDDSDPFGS